MSHIRFSPRARYAALALALTAIGSPYAQAANLLDVYDQAAQSDPTIRAAEASRLASREARPQAFASFLPTITANASWAGTTAGQDTTANPNGTVNGLSTTTRGGTWGISAVESINIPTTLRNLKRTDYTLALADLTYHSAEQNLVVRVAQRYFNVLAARDSLNAAQANLESLNQQLERAEKRFDVGLSAITDVQEARAQRDRANSTVISSKRTLATNQELLREITGSMVNDLAAPGDDMPLISPDPQSEDEWVQKALNGNMDLATARINLDAATYDLGTKKLTRLPSVTIGANYKNSNAYEDFSPLGADNTNNSWSGTWFSVGVSVPIFSGGSISSTIRQYVYQQRAARERLEQSNRETERSARDAYLGVQSAITQVQANKQALESSRLALEATQAGYDVGTRTTIDVLSSRQSLLTAEQTYYQSRYTYITNLITLKTTTGSLSREDLQQINSWLTQ
ncbi:MAG: TolC family outer membrane protein [Steroidobacteraceae bacterium]